MGARTRVTAQTATGPWQRLVADQVSLVREAPSVNMRLQSEFRMRDGPWAYAAVCCVASFEEHAAVG